MKRKIRPKVKLRALRSEGGIIIHAGGPKRLTVRNLIEVDIYEILKSQTITMAALPDKDYEFDHWELDGVNVGSANPISVAMDKDHELAMKQAHRK